MQGSNLSKNIQAWDGFGYKSLFVIWCLRKKCVIFLPDFFRFEAEIERKKRRKTCLLADREPFLTE
jgi:hypothetical protein